MRADYLQNICVCLFCVTYPPRDVSFGFACDATMMSCLFVCAFLRISELMEEYRK